VARVCVGILERFGGVGELCHPAHGEHGQTG